MKPASHHEATTPGTPAEAQGIVTPQRAYAPAAGLAKGFLLTPLVETPRGGVLHTFLKSRPHSAGRPYTIHIYGAKASRQSSGFIPMENKMRLEAETQQLSLNLQVHDTVHNTSPETEPVTEFSGNGNRVSPSRLPLIRQSPLAPLPMEQALAHLATPDSPTPPGVDPAELSAFTRGLIRCRVMTVEWAGVSFLNECQVDLLWSPELKTGIVLDIDHMDEIYVGSEINSPTTEEIVSTMSAIYFSTGGPYISECGGPITVDRNLLPEEALIDLFMDDFEGTREVARQACKVELDKCVRWVDHIDVS